MREAVTSDGLTDRQRRYVAAVRSGLKGAEAAREAGYTGGLNALRVTASRLKRNPKVVAVLDGSAPARPASSVPFPQKGPQHEFASCGADIALFGGAAGGGKSWSMLFDFVKWARYVDGSWCLPEGMRGVIFRRTAPELVGGGGLWDLSQETYRQLGARSRGGSQLDWTFPGFSIEREKHERTDGVARLEFRHLHRPKDRFAHQGRQYAFIGFDELTHFEEAQFWYLVSRLRSTCGVTPYLRATCNPDPDSFVFDLVKWWIGEDGYAIPARSGVVRWFVRVDGALHWFASADEAREAYPGARPLSFAFIAAKTTDNRILMEHDPGYVARLESLTYAERMRLLGENDKGGNWLVRDAAGLVFSRADFRLVDDPPSRVLRTVRFWDKAASEPTEKHPNPDWTRGVRVSVCEGGLLYIDDIASMQKRGTLVLDEMRRTAESDTVAVTQGVWQDTGGAGKTDIDTTITALAGYPVEIVESFVADTTGVTRSLHKSTRPKRAFASAWAPWVKQGRVYVKNAPWSKELLAECHGFPDARFDDIVDAISGGFQVLVGSGFSWWETIKAAAAAGS